MPEINLNSRDYFDKRQGALRLELESFITHYKDLSTFIQPRRGRFFTSDRNKGDKRNQKIINSRGTMALRTATSGLMQLTSPARPWFRFETIDPDLMNFGPVKVWLAEVEAKMRDIFAAGNLYNALPILYTELLLFGTGAMTMLDDFEDVSRFYSHTVGSYALGQNFRLEVDTMSREFEMQVGQLVGQFGLENVSKPAKDLWDRGDYDKWIPVVHIVEPNPTPDQSNPFAQNMPFRSVYFEKGQRQDKKFLRRGGFLEQPFFAPRWEVTGEDIYATNCPGMTALGDVKGLQVTERRKAQAIDKMVSPPLKGPGALKNIPISSLPGGINIYDSGDREGLTPVYQVSPRLQEMMLDIQDTERRIDEAFFADLFFQLSNLDGVQPRNQLELSMRNEEKLLMLGPVLERLEGELLDKLIDRQFAQMVRADILPTPPDELAGVPLKVKYISSLAQAQRSVGSAGIERYVNFVGGLAQIDPNAVDKIDIDQAIDDWATLVGVSPKIVRANEDADQIREARAQQQQMAQQLQAAQQGADIAKTASQADLEGDNALTRAANFSGGGQ